jgi:tRNA G10  N-methylase Trm11
VPNQEPALNSAQVLHNQLTSALGWELIFIRDGNSTILAQNIAEQDIESYTIRDRGRPLRDAHVGMLPPKLAQIIINLAVGAAESASQTCEPGELKNKTLLDPFCGTGVLLQEALLMGYTPYGTDLEPRMVQYSRGNLDWLDEQRDIRKPAEKAPIYLEVADATNYRWPEPFDIVAAETYLGRPFTALPPPAVLQETISDTNLILKRFLQNITPQMKPGTRLCLALPAWKLQNGFKHLPLLDSVTDMGYTRMSFVHVRNDQLVYHRPEQVVARELVVLIRK